MQIENGCGNTMMPNERANKQEEKTMLDNHELPNLDFEAGFVAVGAEADVNGRLVDQITSGIAVFIGSVF
ncbi:MAG TPA: hypothetical protein VLA64_06420 [Azonexus sp.]|nr:hypothetical protein [Azonexus sp.]